MINALDIRFYSISIIFQNFDGMDLWKVHKSTNENHSISYHISWTIDKKKSTSAYLGKLKKIPFLWHQLHEKMTQFCAV